MLRVCAFATAERDGHQPVCMPWGRPMRLVVRVTTAGSGAPTGGSEGASAQGMNQLYVCTWLTLPLGSMVMVVTVFV